MVPGTRSQHSRQVTSRASRVAPQAQRALGERIPSASTESALSSIALKRRPIRKDGDGEVCMLADTTAGVVYG